MNNHYKWLENNLPSFFESVGLNPDHAIGSISASGDKCYSHSYIFEKNGLHFYHGVSIYLILGFTPFSEQVRNTENGWVDPFQWIIDNKDQFISILPKID